ncbi:glycosyltransferase family 2 protein, partial [Sulfitobacter sp. CW3]|nr:glycosyltransferase family 2 protein [Sulfitobacter sp. CW3]
NNDIEVLEPGWLAELVRHAVRPEIGAVGAKLLYPDRTIQHGGIVLGIGGVAGHSHLGVADADPGYFCRMVIAHEVSAVTGACLAM